VAQRLRNTSAWDWNGRRVLLVDATVGVVNFLANRGQPEPGSEAYGKAFENWVFHELRCYNQYEERYAQFSFWRLSPHLHAQARGAWASAS
jgi:hypothetical protein